MCASGGSSRFDKRERENGMRGNMYMDYIAQAANRNVDPEACGMFLTR